jgi:L,D-peptidoglycan transpeptidase YkuD (ErfK/YbiS/YcfS/YnhG family)
MSLEPSRTLQRIFVAPLAETRQRGILAAGTLTIPCALGRAGIRHHKRESDGATPAGGFRLVALLYRPDRVRRPATALPALPIRPHSGWCDDPGDRNYNRPVDLPYPASHERLWRDDHLYDLLVVLDYNLENPRPGAGSAIFLHLAAPGLTPTAGCVAIAPTAMRRLLARVGPRTEMIIV